jgi:HK97 family phage major capsid protein
MDKLLYRYLKATPTGLKKEPNGVQTMRVCFSSETPVFRSGDAGDYYEVLDHGPANVDISMLQNGAFLDQHDHTRQVGGVLRAWIDRDKKGRADVAFGNTELGNERKELMSSGLRPDISFGYETTKELSKSRHADGRPVIRFAWKAHEISSVAVGADHFETGVGRSTIQKINEKRHMKTMDNKTAIIDTCDFMIHDNPHLEPQIRDIKSRALLDNVPHTQVKDEVRSLLDANRPTQVLFPSGPIGNGPYETVPVGATSVRVPNKPIGMNQRQIQAYSIKRAIQSIVSNGRLDGPEKDYSDEVEKQCGERAAGFFIPADVAINPLTVPGQRRFGQRDLQAEVFGAGGALVNNQMMSTIELLRNRVVCSRLGARSMGGLQGNVIFPREDAPATAYSAGEIAPLTPSQLTLGQIVLSPKKCGAQTIYSKQLVFQSTPDAEALIRDDLLQVIAISHDSLLINGSGSNSQPMGVLSTPGIGSITFGGAPTYAEILEFETLIGKQNADIGKLAWATTPGTKGIWKGTAVALQGATTVSSRSLWSDGNFNDDSNDGIVNGYRSASTNQIPNDQVIFGNWSDLIYAQWNGFDVVVDYVTRAGQAEIVLTITTWLDSALRHGQSFVASSDPGSQ